MCGVGNAKSPGVQRFCALSDGAAITRGSGATPLEESRDFCPLTTLFDGCDFPEMHRRDDHSISAVLYVLEDQINGVGLKTGPHEILVIVGTA